MTITINSQIELFRTRLQRATQITPAQRVINKRVRSLLSQIRASRRMREKAAMRSKFTVNFGLTPKEVRLMTQVRDMLSVDQFDYALSMSVPYLPVRRVRRNSDIDTATFECTQPKPQAKRSRVPNSWQELLSDLA